MHARCECRRDIVIRLSPIRNPHSRHAHSGKPTSVKNHGLCMPCWRHLIAGALASQRNH